jgi:manganese transport protein
MPMRDESERHRVLRFERLDIVIALACAGLVNMAMLAVAAKLFHSTGHTGVDSIQAAYHGFGNQVGGLAALAFAVALFASGASSSSVGTYAGQVVMAGFINVRVPVMARRALTMIPALVVLAVGLNPTDALVLSQVVLSFGIPVALVPLVVMTSSKKIMGEQVNGPLVTVLAYAVAAGITLMNGFLIFQQIAG